MTPTNPINQANQIEQMATDALIPYARNSRTHSETQVAQVAASIKEFGFTNPVLIDAQNILIAGHGRVMAAKKLGLETVPAIRLGYLTEAQKRAYVIADNKLALNAGWDDEMLALELSDLQDLDFDLDLTGFSILDSEQDHEDETDEQLDSVFNETEKQKKSQNKKYDLSEKIKTKYKKLIEKTAESFKDIVQELPEKGEQINIITDTSFNAISVISHLYKTQKVTEIDIAIYRMNLRSVDFLKTLFKDSSLKGTILFSSFFRENKKYEQWVDELLAFDSGNFTIKTEWNHAKVAIIKTETDHFVFEGSGNLSDNARIEQYSLTNDQNLYQFHKNWINKI